MASRTQEQLPSESRRRLGRDEAFARQAHFRSRTEAGCLLADQLSRYQMRTDTLVLAVPNGGVPVAYEVARALRAPLDVMVVRRMDAPQQSQLAVGAIATGGVRVRNKAVLETLDISENELERIAERVASELDQEERQLRGARRGPRLACRTVLLVDDGLATATSMRSAMAAARAQGVARLVVAVPVAPKLMVEALRREVDDLVCLVAPEQFFGVHQFYSEFSKVSTEEARGVLERAWLEGLEPERC
jgi:putative phosphoribosyl transferase